MRLRDAMVRAAETARLMVGLPDYDRYLAHRRAAHPHDPAMTRDEFHRERTDRRFGAGTSRCC